MAGRRERNKQELRTRISDTATALFLARGFDEVSVAEIAEAADVARPTVFAHFPRKEDLLFDRAPEMTEFVVAAVRDRPPGAAPLVALREALVAGSRDRDVMLGIRGSYVRFFRLVARSRPLQARARELVDVVEAALAAELRAAGQPDPGLAAALAVAAVRSVRLAAIRRLLAGEDADAVADGEPERIGAALRVVERALAATSAQPAQPA